MRQKTRELIVICGRKGRASTGSRNSIRRYVPAADDPAMVDEALLARSLTEGVA